MKITQKDVVKAIQIAQKYHRGQKYGGKDYFDKHIMGVVETSLNLPYQDIHETMLYAYLHDVLEDAKDKEKAKQEILKNFGETVLKNLQYLNVKQFETYDDYMENLTRNAPKVILRVKYADMAFNFTDAIMNVNHPKYQKWMEKYSKWLPMLGVYIQ